MRKRRWPRWLLVLAGLLALWLGSLAWVQTDLRRQAAYSTGDALLDRCLELALPEGALTADSAAQLKAEFGSDPHLWELLQLLAVRSTYLSEQFPQLWSQPITDLLNEARAQDAISAPLLDRHILSLELEWEANTATPQTDTTSVKPTTLIERDKQRREDRAAMLARSKLIHERHGPQREQLYNELVALEPDNSAGYYRRAQMHYSVGNYERALSDIHRGNAAPRNDALLPFPLVERLRMLREGNDIGDEKKLTLYSMWWMTDNFVFHKNFMHGMWDYALESGDPQLLQSVHDLMCRDALKPENDLVKLLVARIGFGHQARTAAAGLEAGSAESIAVSRYSGELRSLLTELKRIQAHSPHRNALNASGPLAWLTERLGLPGEKAFVRAIMADEAEQLQMIDTSVRPIIERLAEFDWRTLTWPNDDASLPLPEPAAD